MSDKLWHDFYDADPISQVAINLFYGWGYNFYRAENQLRADDLLIRHQIAAILGDARVAIDAVESAYRDAHFPPLSREHPRPDPQALKHVKLLEALSVRVGAIAGRVRSAPVPENDRIFQRHRLETDTLARLVRADAALIGHAETLRKSLREQSPEAVLLRAAELDRQASAIEDKLRERQEILDLPLSL